MAPTSRSSTVLQKLRVAFSSHFFASSIFFILRNTVPSIRSFLPEKFGSTSAYKKKSKLICLLHFWPAELALFFRVFQASTKRTWSAGEGAEK